MVSNIIRADMGQARNAVATMSYIFELLLETGVDVARRQDPVGIGTNAEVIDVVCNVGPAMRHCRWNDDYVAGIDDTFDDVGPGDDAATRRPIQHLRHFAIRCGFASVYDAATGDKCAAAGEDDVSLGLVIV